MKKIGILVGVLVLVLALVAGISAADSDNDDATLIVGFDAEFPPYGYKADNGSYVGFDLELAQEVCNRNNWTFKAQPIDWDAKDSELSSGTIDCIWNGFSITEDRKDKYTWSKPYVNNKQVIMFQLECNYVFTKIPICYYIVMNKDLIKYVVVIQCEHSRERCSAPPTAFSATAKTQKTWCRTFS